MLITPITVAGLVEAENDERGVFESGEVARVVASIIMALCNLSRIQEHQRDWVINFGRRTVGICRRHLARLDCKRRRLCIKRYTYVGDPGEAGLCG